jgi:hypothetical protein
VKHYGPEPPWRGEGAYGYWRFVPADSDSWFDEPGHWQWYPKRTTLASLDEALRKYYRPLVQAL